MRREQGRLEGAGGVALHFSSRLPDRDPQAVVVLTHGMAEHGGRYADLAGSLVEAGCGVFAIDLRGHGLSGGRRLQVDSFDDYLGDLLSMVREARRRLPGVPLFLLGHSMGGLVALLLAIRHQDEIDFLVLSGALSAVPAGVSRMTVALGRLLSALVPGAGATPVDLGQVSRDPEVVAAYMADPLVTKIRKVPARLGIGLYDAIGQARVGVASLTKPVLILHGSDDRLSDPAGSRYLYQHVGSPDRTLRIYDGLFHEIFNEPERAVVIADLLAWVKAHR